MFPQTGRNLTLALCLALQMAAVFCMVCPCMQSKAAMADTDGADETPISESHGCQQCRANSDAQPPQRVELSERHQRISAAATIGVCLTDGSVLERRTTEAAVPALPTVHILNLQVFLE